MHYFGGKRLQQSAGDVYLAEMDATAPEVPEHSHDEAHLVLVLGGRYLSSAAQMDRGGETNAVLFNPPGTTHRDCFAACEGRFLILSWPAEAWDSIAGRSAKRRSAHRLGLRAWSTAQALRADLRRWDFASPLDAQVRAHALLADIAQVTRDAGPVPPWLARARDRLEHDADALPSLSQVAADCGVHPAQLSRAFRRHYGRSPGEHVRERRLDRLGELLSRRDAPSLGEAAQRAGFFDQAHMTRCLRAATGLTPAGLRGLIRALDKESAESSLPAAAHRDSALS
jgi:AraC family transcriptional regulator